MTLVLLNTIQRHNTAPDPEDLWAWAFAWVGPPLTTILGCFAATALGKTGRDLSVDPFFYRMVLAISLFELLILLFLLSLEPFDRVFNVADFARATKGWATGGQGLFAIAMSGIFFRAKKTSGPGVS
jgi:hypothetical protein